MRFRRKEKPRKICPACGASIPAKALACRECGSDAETGWSAPEDQLLAQVELPEFDEEDYRRVVAGLEGRPRAAMPLWLRLAVILTLIAFFLLIFGR